MELHQVIADFRVEGTNELEEKLESAVGTARDQALMGCHNRGVLVTRHDFDHYSVSLSPQIPFGLTREQDNASRN
ncbi:hypothetical protein [Pseudarthrobacter sulfonivorans]|uniref:hypothetical protein n=1 Tax=Pseudarthrobacter sulfonivorans TaxID=121292 RepID=UPI00285EED5C|nr:hypothetical protein [Pseudarthrobacter sulfonivorans]MDR6417703.1 hypothetical protein [Pseudarthrobacter sulfonivorans]